MRELNGSEVMCVSGGSRIRDRHNLSETGSGGYPISGYDGATAVLGVLAVGAIAGPVGIGTVVFAGSVAGGLAAAQFMADHF